MTSSDGDRRGQNAVRRDRCGGIRALGGRQVHVVTISDYLARRDAGLDGALLKAMGLTVRWITSGVDPPTAARRLPLRCHLRLSVSRIGWACCAISSSPMFPDLVSPNPDVALIGRADSVLVDEDANCP